jgi:hypothetical protein
MFTIEINYAAFLLLTGKWAGGRVVDPAFFLIADPDP